MILGAGASVAAFPQGDRNKKKLPVMHNLVETIGLADLLSDAGVAFEGRNFEDIYSSICGVPAHVGLTSAIDGRVAEYFRQLALPDCPTIYDYLVLCLREKDVIATFNWDPFLWLACARNYWHAKPPTVIFLHGCAIVGFCREHKPISMGQMGRTCGKCGKPYLPRRLLFPMGNKNYTDDPCIAAQWKTMKSVLEDASLLTVFGYGAPVTDAAAVDLMSQAWGSPHQRVMEEIEIIDIVCEEQLVKRWDRFIHSHHYRVLTPARVGETSTDFFGSLVAKHPRRSCEAMFHQNIEAEFIEDNPVPICGTFDELWKWFEPLWLAERQK